MKKIKDEGVIDGYKIGNLILVIQEIIYPKTGIPFKAVFGTLKLTRIETPEEKSARLEREKISEVEESLQESINFTFPLRNIPSFKNHIISMIHECVSKKSKGKKVIKKRDATVLRNSIKKQSK